VRVQYYRSHAVHRKVKEEFEDHCFYCIRAKYRGYWHWHDHIRDSMHEVFRKLGHLAEITHYKDDVMRELQCWSIWIGTSVRKISLFSSMRPFKIQPEI
jgi:hypothetical protein